MAANKFAAIVTVLLVGALVSTTTLAVLYSNEINDESETSPPTVPTQPPTPSQTQPPTPPQTQPPTQPPTSAPRPDDVSAISF